MNAKGASRRSVGRALAASVGVAFAGLSALGACSKARYAECGYSPYPREYSFLLDLYDSVKWANPDVLTAELPRALPKQEPYPFLFPEGDLNRDGFVVKDDKWNVLTFVEAWSFAVDAPSDAEFLPSMNWAGKTLQGIMLLVEAYNPTPSHDFWDEKRPWCFLLLHDGETIFGTGRSFIEQYDFFGNFGFMEDDYVSWFLRTPLCAWNIASKIDFGQVVPTIGFYFDILLSQEEQLAEAKYNCQMEIRDLRFLDIPSVFPYNSRKYNAM